MTPEILQSPQPKTAPEAASLPAPVASTSEPTLGQDIASLLRYGLYAIRVRFGTRGLIFLAAVAVVAGVSFSWPWLVAVGIAPILLAVLPCAVMCALGVCMKPKGEASNRRESASNETPDSDAAGSRSTRRSDGDAD